ncbi:hypothetical protein QYE76_004418 [Lolium multiflorum]|uniref:Uncharacterized protein n=1 Tax=Lolium multiflorum TaxID=4521 RepID=A0AAD8RQP1_LOLMU|nr:hypothetical protein QYE76_004418 [Lolium multiflorum]
MSSGHLVCFNQFVIIRYPALRWSHDQMWEMIQACMIMHNMIIEDDRNNHVRTHIDLYECQGPLAEVLDGCESGTPGVAACAYVPPLRPVRGDYEAPAHRVLFLHDGLVRGPVVDSIHFRPSHG